MPRSRGGRGRNLLLTFMNRKRIQGGSNRSKKLSGASSVGGRHETSPDAAAGSPSSEAGVGDFSSLAEFLKQKRKARRLSLTRLAKLAGVPLKVVKDLETPRVNAVGIQYLGLVANALGSDLSIRLLAIPPELPKTTEEILREFDKLLKSQNCRAFMRRVKDKEYPNVLWDVVGDAGRNWLYVVAVSPRKKVRLAAVTDNPGGWSIGGQMFGMDMETQMIAEQLSEQLLERHRSELT